MWEKKEKKVKFEEKNNSGNPCFQFPKNNSGKICVEMLE
jgi:hypothetical protein